MCHNCFPVIDFRKQLEICKEFTYSAEKFLQAFFIFFMYPQHNVDQSLLTH